MNRPILLQEAVIHHQVVGGGFTGHIQPLFLRLANQVNAFLGGNVANMISAAGFCHQFQISCNLLILAGTANALVAMGRTVSAVMDVTAFQQVIYLAVGHNHFSQAFLPSP